MKNSLCYTVWLVFVFFSCKSTAPVQNDYSPEGKSLLYVNNPTPFTVYFEGNQKIESRAEKAPLELALDDSGLTSGFDVLYEIPLDRSFPLFCVGDTIKVRQERDTVTLAVPDFVFGAVTRNYGTWLKIINKTGNTVTLLAGNYHKGIWEQRGSHLRGNYPIETGTAEFSSESAVYGIENDFPDAEYTIAEGRKRVSFCLPPVKKNFVYEITYDGVSATLTDARPLHRVGESSWSKEAPGAVSALHIIGNLENGPLSLTAFSGNRLTRYGLDQERGLEKGETLGVNENEYIDLRAIAVSGEPGCFIAAGGVDSLEGAFGDPVYTAWIGALGNDASLLWETDLGRFETGGLNFYGSIQSLVREKGQDRYYFCGELIPQDVQENPAALPGAYMGSFRVVEGRAVLEEPPVLFEGLSLTQILCANDNSLYLAGKRRANERIGALVKSRDSGGRERWEFSQTLPGNSWHQCGLVDENQGRIILAGTLGASEPSGEGGRPFIQALAMEDGEMQWLRILEEDVFKNMTLITSIAKASEYGYVITLSRISEGRETGPFMAARVNEAGRYIP